MHQARVPQVCGKEYQFVKHCDHGTRANTKTHNFRTTVLVTTLLGVGKTNMSVH